MALGTIQTMEKRETDSGKTYYRIQIGDMWGSFWGSAENIGVGDEVEYKRKVKEKGGNTYTNWTKLAIPQEEDSSKEGMEDKIDRTKDLQNQLDSKDRQIIRQVALKEGVQYAKILAQTGVENVDTNDVTSAASIFEEWLLEGVVAKM